MIYTCYDMIRDCREGRREGWAHFVSRYVPAVRRMVAHYFPARRDDAALFERILKSLHGQASSLFDSFDPAPERHFLLALRAHVRAEAERECAPQLPSCPLDLETLAGALAPLTLLEKQAVWFEAMNYGPDPASRMLKMSADTAARARDRADELLRSKMDAWRRGAVADNAAGLMSAALQAKSPDCLPAKAFLDIIDGRATWVSRGQMERHAASCWHCIDHFCRLREVSLLRDMPETLGGAEAEHCLKLLGFEPEKPSLWKRLRGK
jgi:hypothetical protein